MLSIVGEEGAEDSLDDGDGGNAEEEGQEDDSKLVPDLRRERLFNIVNSLTNGKETKRRFFLKKKKESSNNTQQHKHTRVDLCGQDLLFVVVDITKVNQEIGRAHV